MRKRNKVIILSVSVAACILLGCVFFWFSGGKKLEYYLKNEASGAVQINVTLRQPIFFKLENAEFYVCGNEMSDIKCVDENSSRVEYTIKDGIIELKNIGNHQLVSFSYEVNSPPVASITAFSGNEALIIPVDWTNLSRITIDADSYDNADIILPSTSINKPAWIDIHNLSKSCFAFGNFRKHKSSGNVAVYMGNALSEDEDTAILDAVNAVNLYYKEVFSGIPRYSLVISPRDEDGKAAEIVGGLSMIMPFDINNPDDCKAFCHSLFYAFFDKYVDLKELRFSPNIWLNRGLATYYESLSLDVLPESIPGGEGLKSEIDLCHVYTRYLYFRTKESSTYNATPGEEGILNSAPAQFYYYTKAPLIVAFIENQSGNNHSLIKNLIKNSGKTDYTVKQLMYDTVSEKTSNVLDLLNNKNYIPAPTDYREKDSLAIFRAIVDYEYVLDSWYLQSSPEYPVEVLRPLNPAKVLDMTDELNITFSDSEIEALVWDYSVTLFALLRQNALRAYACDADISDPALRFFLATSENKQIWEEFILEHGLEDTGD